MRVGRDSKANAAQSYETNIVPVVPLTNYPPILGSIVFSADTATPYYADGVQWPIK